MIAHIQISLGNEHPFFNETTADLLRYIDATHCVRTACELAGISYSKAWQSIRRLEEETGRTMVTRTQGGRVGAGRSGLTGDGRKLLQTYTDYAAEVRRSAGEEYGRRFGNLFSRKLYLICAGSTGEDNAEAHVPVDDEGRVRSCLLWRFLSDANIGEALVTSGLASAQTAAIALPEVKTELLCPSGGMEETAGLVRERMKLPGTNLALVSSAENIYWLTFSLSGEAELPAAPPPGSVTVFDAAGGLHMTEYAVLPRPDLGPVLFAKILNTLHVREDMVRRILQKAEEEINDALLGGETDAAGEARILLRSADGLFHGGGHLEELLKRTGYPEL